MRKAKLDKIGRIATSTRKHIVEFTKSMSDDDRTYYPFPNPSLACWCAISSMVLIRRLAERRIKSEIVVGVYGKYAISKMVGFDIHNTNHSWVVTEKKIVDITVSQFDDDLPAVAIADIKDPNWKELRRGEEAISAFSLWPFAQSPIKPPNYRYNKIDSILNFIEHAEFG